MPTNTQVSSDIDTLLRLPSKVAVQDYLGVDDNTAGVAANAAAILLKAPILDATFTGTTTIPSADITTADFNAGGLGGEVSWNAGEKTLDLVTGANGTTIQLGQEVVLYCRNKTATDLVDGQIVKIVGATANTPNIELAIASTTDEAHKTFGVVTQTIPANNGEGFITLMGKVRDLRLRTQDGFVEGELVYLSSTVAGALTPTKPLIEVEIGRVLRTGTNNGTLGVSINNEASIYELQQTVPHNTDAVIICNQGDNIQTKYGEASQLTPNGNPRSATNRATLVVMTGTYGNLSIGSSYVDVIGIGSPTLGSVGSTQAADKVSNFENFTCSSFSIVEFGSQNFIKDLNVTGQLSIEYNYGVVDNCRIGSFYNLQNGGYIKNIVILTTGFYIDDVNYGTIDNVTFRSTGGFTVEINSGTIKNSSAYSFLVGCYNYGIIDNCQSRSVSGGRSFAGGSFAGNLGTIRNCTSESLGSFGGQSSTGVTENCVGVDQSFAGNGNLIDWGYDNGDLGVAGVWRNCSGGNNSFFGLNQDTTPRTIYGQFINCTAGNQSFGWVNAVGATTIWNGYAKNCIAQEKSFCSAGMTGGTARIEAGAIIENCSAGSNSFGTFNSSTNEGFVLSCRTLDTGANSFNATGTGKVRLCLDGFFEIINIPTPI